jgi:hypothetical protein
VPRRAQAKAYSSPSAARRALDGFAKKNPPRACVLEVVRGSDTVAVWLMMEEGQEVPW